MTMMRHGKKGSFFTSIMDILSVNFWTGNSVSSWPLCGSRNTIATSRFNYRETHMRVACLSNPALPATTATGVFPWNEPRIGHELFWASESREFPDFCDEGNRRNFGYAAQCLQSLNHRCMRAFCRLCMHFLFQSLDSLFDLMPLFLKSNLLRTMLPLQRVQPLLVFGTPITDT